MVGALQTIIRIAERLLFVMPFVLIALAAFMFAGLSYYGGDYLAAIATTGMLALALLIVQTVDRNTFRPRTWNLPIAANTVVVGVAIHYSAIIIGVSFGAVFSPESGSIGAVIAVLAQQVVLTRAAWILVNQFRAGDAANTNRNTQGR